MQYFVILTVQAEVGLGLDVNTWSDIVNAPPGATRADIYAWARNQMRDEMRHGNVLHFSAEPNNLPDPA